MYTSDWYGDDVSPTKLEYIWHFCTMYPQKQREHHKTLIHSSQLYTSKALEQVHVDFLSVSFVSTKPQKV